MSFSRWAALPLIVGLSVTGVACGDAQTELEEQPTENLETEPVDPNALPEEDPALEETEEPMETPENQ